MFPGNAANGRFVRGEQSSIDIAPPPAARRPINLERSSRSPHQPHATEARHGALIRIIRALRVDVHAGFIASDWALYVFSAAVFTQCLHYGAVIHVLPRLLPSAAAMQLAPWLRPESFGVATVVAAIVSTIVFAIDFGDARKFYGLAAMIHAWIEVPILALMLADGLGQDESEHHPAAYGAGVGEG